MADIFENLKDQIEKIVQRDGIKEEFILPNETKEDVLQAAVDNIYYDVLWLFDWYFVSNDNRNNFAEPVSDAPTSLITAVREVVKDNLEAMQEADELDPTLNVSEDAIVDNLVGYIINWEKWFYDRKVEDDWDTYYESQEFFDEIYDSDTYGNETFLGGLYDEEDVPYKD